MGKNKNPAYEKAYELYKKGFSLEQVAKEMGITRQGLFNAFNRRGYQLRGANFKNYSKTKKNK